MSDNRTPHPVRWPLHFLALGTSLAALVGLIVIVNASAAPPDAMRPAEVSNASQARVTPPSASLWSVDASPIIQTASPYRPPNGRSTAARLAPANAPKDDTPFARANTDWDAVDGWFGPGVTVQYTVTRGVDTIGGAAGVAKADGWMDGVWCGCDMQPGDHAIVRSSAGFSAELVLITITGVIDVNTDRINGRMFDGVFPRTDGVSIGVWSPARNEGYGRNADLDADGNYVADFAPDFDIHNGDRAEVWYNDLNGNQVGAMLYTPYLHVRANSAHDWVQGDATPQTTVFVTVTRGAEIIATGQAFTGGGTWYHINPQRPEGNNVDMRTGDIVDVTAGALSASVLLIDMDGVVNAATDVVSGKLVGVPFPADVRIEDWRDGESRALQTDAAGNFNVDFDAYDIHQGDHIGIWYVQPDGHFVGIVRSDFRFEVELRDNDLWGMTTPRSQVDLEIRSPTRTLIGATTVWTDQEGNYGTDFRDAAGQRIDIQAGDIIVGTCGAKQAVMTIPAPFAAAYDYTADTVCGQAPSGAQVQVDLWGYGTQYPVADASHSYCATFGGDPGIETEGQSRIDLPVGHSVLLRFRTLAPDLYVNKWSNGQPPAGGYHRYVLRVGNGERADLAAAGVVLTDTLPAGMTFESESTGTATVTGQRVVWRLGTIAQGTEREIALTTRVAESVAPGAELENCAEIAAGSWEGYRGDNTVCDRQSVVENLADPWVGGWMSPGDPAPAGEYIYHIDYGNNRPAGSRNVRITDTLPPGTTFVSEWHPDRWTVDTSQPGQIIWSTDLMPGWDGWYLELRLRVNSDVAPGTQLHNRVEIAGEAPDVDLNNNAWESDAGVQNPYSNVSIGKWYSHGIPVAGYEYTTWVHVWNNSNVPATTAVLTDTLPADATFVRATQWEWDASGDYNTSRPLPPDAQGAGWVRWNLPPITPWREFRLQVTFRVGAGTAPGTELINRADVTLPDDQDPGNNHAEYRFRTQGPGPNLRVTKWYDWGDVQPGNTIQYQLRFESDGTEPIYDLVFQDILPDHTTLNGFSWGEQPAIVGNTLTWTPNWQQNPGDQLGFWLQVRVDDDTPAGALLTNTAQGATSSTEGQTGDNQAQVTLVVGPDLRVEKELLDEGIRPGYRARYRIHVWNDGYATARNVVLTDILPEGLTFVRSDWGGDVQGNQVIWHLGDLGRDWRGEFDMEVDAARELAVGSTVTNRLEITNDLGDADPGDNAFELASTVNSPCRIDVQESHNWVAGSVLPNAHVVIVLRDSGNAEKTRYETDANDDGYFWAPFGVDIVPGDQIAVDTEGSATIVIPVIRIEGAVDPVADRIMGRVYGVPYPAQVIGEVWAKNGANVSGQTDGAGNYNLSFAPFDVRNGHTVALWYVRPDGHRVGIVRQALFVRVYPADDNLWGSTAPNTAVNVTLRDAVGALKGSAAVTSGPEGDWGTDIFDGATRVEISDHDQVQVTAGGLTANLVVPRIILLPDAPHDRLEVYSELPDTELEIRWDSTPGQDNHDFSLNGYVTTDGAGRATLDFGPYGGLEADVTGNLYYYNADGHCIEPWWRSMIELVDPTTTVNTASEEIEIIGAGFRDTPTVYLGHNGAQQISLTDVRLIGTTGAVLRATVPAGTPAGVYELQVNNPDERIGFLVDALTVRNPTPGVTSITPNTGFFDETISFSITGNNFVAGAQVLFTDGAHVLTPVGVTVVSATQITGALDLHGATPGLYDVVVKNAGPGEPSDTLTDGLRVVPRWWIRLPLILRAGP